MTRVSGQPVVYVSLDDFWARGERRDGPTVRSRRRISTFEDRYDKGFFLKMRKVTFFHTFVGENTQGRENYYFGIG